MLSIALWPTIDSVCAQPLLVAIFHASLSWSYMNPLHHVQWIHQGIGQHSASCTCDRLAPGPDGRRLRQDSHLQSVNAWVEKLLLSRDKSSLLRSLSIARRKRPPFVDSIENRFKSRIARRHPVQSFRKNPSGRCRHVTSAQWSNPGELLSADSGPRRGWFGGRWDCWFHHNTSCKR